MGREFRRFDSGFRACICWGGEDTPLIAHTTNGEQISPNPRTHHLTKTNTTYNLTSTSGENQRGTTRSKFQRLPTPYSAG